MFNKNGAVSKKRLLILLCALFVIGWLLDTCDHFFTLCLTIIGNVCIACLSSKRIVHLFQILEIQPNKAALGKQYKGDAKVIFMHLEAMSDCDKQEVQQSLEENGFYELKVGLAAPLSSIIIHPSFTT